MKSAGRRKAEGSAGGGRRTQQAAVASTHKGRDPPPISARNWAGSRVGPEGQGGGRGGAADPFARGAASDGRINGSIRRLMDGPLVLLLLLLLLLLLPSLLICLRLLMESEF